MSAIPPLTPYLTVSDAVAAIEFYIKAFNALPDGEPHLMPETGKIMHMRLMVNGSMIMLADDLAAMMGHPPSTPEALGGSPVTLADLHGRPAFVVFWASWCDPCASEAPAIERFARGLGARARLYSIRDTTGGQPVFAAAPGGEPLPV